jgi:hypothetical protein
MTVATMATIVPVVSLFWQTVVPELRMNGINLDLGGGRDGNGAHSEVTQTLSARTTGSTRRSIATLITAPLVSTICNMRSKRPTEFAIVRVHYRRDTKSKSN